MTEMLKELDRQVANQARVEAARKALESVWADGLEHSPHGTRWVRVARQDADGNALIKLAVYENNWAIFYVYYFHTADGVTHDLDTWGHRTHAAIWDMAIATQWGGK